VSSKDQEQYQGLVSKYAGQFNVPYDLALAVLETESSYRPDAESEKGAKGLFQLMPFIINTYGVTDPFDPDQNVRAGVQHLGVLLSKYEDPSIAIAAYNAGEPAVNQAGGIPPFPETQSYVQKVTTARNRLMQGQGGGGTVAQERGYWEEWIYPTQRLGSENMRDDEGNPLPQDHPDRQGILISWEGTANDGPSDDQIGQIFKEVDPEGMITREDAASIAALGASVAPGTAKFAARRARDLKTLLGGAARATVAGGRMVPGVGWALPAIAGVAGAGGEYYRQTQVPKEVAGFEIESWPRSQFGMHYEGAPDTPWESAYSMVVKGGQEALGEGLGGMAASAVRGAGRWLKGTGFNRNELLGMDEASALRTGGRGNIRRELAETGTSPTPASVARANRAASLGNESASAIIKESEEALGPISINTERMIDDVYTDLGGTTNRVEIKRAIESLNLPRATDRILGGILDTQTTRGATRVVSPSRLESLPLSPGRASGYPSFNVIPAVTETTPDVIRNLPLGRANRMRISANEDAFKYYRAAQEAGQVNVAGDAEVFGSLGRVLRNHIYDAMKEAEKRGGLLRRTGRRPRNRGRRFADRWSSQVKNAGQWLRVKNLAKVSSRSPVGGLMAGGLAFGGPSMVGTAMGSPGAGIGMGAALAQLSPTVRSLEGGALYKGAGAMGMAPIQGMRGANIGGQFDSNTRQQNPRINYDSFGVTPPSFNMQNFPTVIGSGTGPVSPVRRRR